MQSNLVLLYTMISIFLTIISFSLFDAVKRITGLGFIEGTLTLLFPYTDIERDDAPGVIYLRRFFIYPRNKDFGKNKGKGRLYLHKFYRGDEDLHLHDHPWPFVSLILTRGYWEETLWRPGDGYVKGSYPTWGADNEWRTKKFYRRFSLLRRPATWKHRVILKDSKPVWTIVKTGVKERSWGFWIKNNLCPWRNYDNGVCWCSPEEKEQHSASGNNEAAGS